MFTNKIRKSLRVALFMLGLSVPALSIAATGCNEAAKEVGGKERSTMRYIIDPRV